MLWHNPHSICCKNQAGIVSNESHNNYEWHIINELQLTADNPSACGTSAEVVSWSLSLNILSEVFCAPPQQPTALSQAGGVFPGAVQTQLSFLASKTEVFLATLISQGWMSGDKHCLLTKSCNGWHHYRSTAISFYFIPPKMP